ncbi:sensor histidine kinase [Mucilaginibacter kameinonensis]|uniref:sensor histidine kinase n=1 Tax=Mucilaginibacter kameinonensis TaxID=452286 RepID=UPI000EF7E20D|nr:ATP-binding protein [Mucilaginibacter kameinonensis]
MLFQEEQVILVIIAGSAFMLLLGVFIIGFMLMYQKKQNKNLLERENLKASFKQEMLKTQIEIQEQTLNDISREIHDNITQVLSFVKLNLGLLNNSLDEEKKGRVNENRELISQTINDLRNLSKSMSFEHISSLGLIKVLEAETERLTRSGIINAVFTVEGDVYSMGEQRELVIFRIFQEAVNNTLKYAKAANLKISLYYTAQMFNLLVEDDGAGFNAEKVENKGGSGLRNIENRAALVGADVIITSSPGKGCQIKLSFNPLVQQIYAKGTHSNSLS